MKRFVVTAPPTKVTTVNLNLVQRVFVLGEKLLNHWATPTLGVAGPDKCATMALLQRVTCVRSEGLERATKPYKLS